MPENDLPLTGGCLCGGVRFEIDTPPVDAGICHCTHCQRRTGTGSAVSAALSPGSLTILQGDALLGAWHPPNGGFAKVFCRACGAALWSQDPAHAQRVAVRFGAFDGDPGIRPRWRQYLRSVPPWDTVPDDDLERFDGPRTR